MALSNEDDGARLAPPSHSRQYSRSATQRIITIEPTDEYQLFYNSNRRDLDKQRLELHVAEEDKLNPPRSHPMSRSTTSESLASPSIASPSPVHSHAVDTDSPFSPEATADTGRRRPPRGKRHGPLDLETRVKTAFKRKFKLTCEYHRKKRTSCNCHDFSKLEEGYRRFVAAEAQTNKALARSTSRIEAPIMSDNDIGTFGIGIAAPTIPRESNFFEGPLANFHQMPPHMQENFSTIFDFNIDSETSVNEMVSANRQQPSFIPMPSHSDILDQSTLGLVPIGHSMGYQGLWQCNFGDDAGSLASASSCSWIGRFDELCSHYCATHHPFEPAEAPYISRCDRCLAITLAWVDEPACSPESGCPPGSWSKWYWGMATPQTMPNTTQGMLTVSEVSGSPYSGLFGGSWNPTTPGSSNVEQPNPPSNPPSGGTGYYNRSVISPSARSDDEGDIPSHLDIRSRKNKVCVGHPQRSASLCKMTAELNCTSLYLRHKIRSIYVLCWCLLSSPLATLIGLYLGAIYWYLNPSNPVSALVIGVSMFSWHSPLAVLGLLTIWASFIGESMPASVWRLSRRDTRNPTTVIY